MMKILCLIDTLSFGGGAERQMAGLAGLLHEKGEDVTLATYHSHDCDDVIESRYGLRSTLISAKGNFISKLFAVREFIKKGNFDVVIAYKDGATMIACLCKSMGLRFKLIVSERNTTQVLSKRDRLKFSLYRYADCIVPNSYSQCTYIKEHFSKLANKIKVITNFTDTKLFHPDEKYQYNLKKTNILVVARINPQKNIERFMEAVKILKELNIPVKIDWFGGIYVGTGPYGNKIGCLYEQANIKDILQFKGDTSKISEVYRKYDAFCLPSLFEGFPNVVCEAMSSGKPVLCSNVCDNPKIVQNGINGFLFDPKSVDDMVAKLKMFCSLSISEKQAMGNQSRIIATSLLSEENFVNNYIHLIHNIN